MNKLALIIILLLTSSAHAYTGYNQGYTMYDRDECIGAVILGECKGQVVIQKQRYHKKCYGDISGGDCIGPMY